MLNGFQRRLPSVERKISEIRPEDIRVRILGTIIDKKGNSVVIDDGTGKIHVTFGEDVSVEINQFVRIFGKVIPLEKGFQIDGEIIQDMEKLDKGLLRRVEELERKLSKTG